MHDGISKTKCSRSIVFDRHKCYRDGSVSIHDGKKSGRPRSVNETVVKNASGVVSSDRRRSLYVIAKSVGFSLGTAFGWTFQMYKSLWRIFRETRVDPMKSECSVLRNVTSARLTCAVVRNRHVFKIGF